MATFREFLSDFMLMDLGFDGYPFTWRNKRESGLIQERLDRGLALEKWLELYPEVRVTHKILSVGQGGAVQGISRGALAKMVSRVNKGPNIWQVGVGTTRDYTDRGLALEKWLELYPEARVTHKILSGFDHTALLLIVHPTHTRWKGRFVYDLQWGKEERCKSVGKNGFKGQWGTEYLASWGGYDKGLYSRGRVRDAIQRYRLRGCMIN
ncbi:hypothetical protein GBA52_024978 [Prunus armeniaca]|nr:hypothetical protein GBA52_024978 [Prunus armeniaca]